MIQRIQTLYLIFVAVFSGLLLNGGQVTFTVATEIYRLSSSGISVIGGTNPEIIQKTMPLMILLVLVPVLAILTIFLYKNRKLQLKSTLLTIFLIIISSLLGCYYTYDFMNRFDATMVFNMKMIFPLISCVLAFLAYRGIQKDDNLVKSYDRLR
jgi:phosphate/sulfate permease